MKWFFYIVEVVFAIISGISESYIYAAYLPAGALSWPEALARATITQVAIVLFGVAAINVYHNAHGGVRGFMAALPANLLTLIFASVAVWFTRESALMFENQQQLAIAQNQPVNFLGTTLDGHVIDPLLIAALPLFQVALNWLAPLIVAQSQPETAEEREARFARELAEAEHKQQMRTLGIKGFVGAAKAGIDAVKGEQVTSPAPAESVVFAEQKTEDAVAIPAVEGLPENRWTPKQYRAFVLAEYGYPMGEDEAISIVRSVGKDERAPTVGRPFIAPIGRLKQRAKRDHERRSGAPKPAQVDAGIAPEMAE